MLQRSPAKYGQAYIHSEFDGDVTYFLVNQFRVLSRALDALEAYLARKAAETRGIRDLLRNERRDLNHRQVELLERACTDSSVEFTVASHKRAHRVADMTARADLYDLENHGYLERFKNGRTFTWWPVRDLTSRLGEETATNRH